jgi:hypothetical protein
MPFACPLTFALVVLDAIREPHPKLDSIVFRSGRLEPNSFSSAVEDIERARNGPPILVSVPDLVR